MASNIFFFVFVVLTAVCASAFAVCDPEWTEYRSHCYKFENQVQQSWQDAETICNSKGGNLVSIGSKGENMFVYKWWVSMLNPLDGLTFQYVWTGYTDKAEEGIWRWSDGSPSIFSRWGGGEANGGTLRNCALMATKGPDELGRLDDGKCAKKRAYICEVIRGY